MNDWERLGSLLRVSVYLFLRCFSVRSSTPLTFLCFHSLKGVGPKHAEAKAAIKC